MEQTKTAGVAITSLVLGILGLVCIGPLGAIPAVICGHIAKSKIKNAAGALKGEGLALAGLILGYVSIGLMVVMTPIFVAIAIPASVKARDRSQQNVCINYLRMIEAAKDQVAIERGYRAGDTVPEEQITASLQKELSSLKCPKGGRYTINSVGKEPECSIHGSLSAAVGTSTTNPGSRRGSQQPGDQSE